MLAGRHRQQKRRRQQDSARRHTLKERRRRHQRAQWRRDRELRARDGQERGGLVAAQQDAYIRMKR